MTETHERLRRSDAVSKMIDPQKKRAMRNIVLLQCAGAPASFVFYNGFMLMYLSAFGFSSATALQLLALPNILTLPILIPAAFMSDRFGKKIMGIIGLLGTIAGFFLITLAGAIPNALGKQMVIIGIVVFGIGMAIFLSSWVALLSPIVPEHMRGRFFGRLRVSWQSVVILITLAVSVLLRTYSSVEIFQLFLVFITGLLVVRTVIYLQIPEIEQYKASQGGIANSLHQVVRIPNFMPFCSYLFLLSLCTGACPWIFALLEKDILLFSADKILFLGTLLLVGGLSGFFLGGKMVDRFGTRHVFLICHFSFGLILFLFLIRQWIPMPLIVTIGFFSMCFGLVKAASGIAITSELLGLIPAENKSLSTAFAMMLQTAGVALSGIFLSKVLSLRILSASWSLFGLSLSQYDAILCGCGIAILLLTVTLGLVPSIIGNARWIPQGE